LAQCQDITQLHDDLRNKFAHFLPRQSWSIPKADLPRIITTAMGAVYGRFRCILSLPGGTSVSTHGLGYLFTALRRQGLIADEFVLQLTTFLRSLDLFLELIVLTTSTLTANQVRHGGKQGTHNPELSCIHSSLPSIDFTPAEPPA
jgi:hypothetical protein